MTEDSPTPPPVAPDPAPAVTKTTDGATYAAFDKTYLKFVGGTHPTKAKATAAAKAAGLDDYEIRTV